MFPRVRLYIINEWLLLHIYVSFKGDVQIHLIYKSAGQEGLVDLLNGEMGNNKYTLPNALGNLALSTASFAISQ